MPRRFTLIPAFGAFCAALSHTSAAPGATSEFFEKHCYECHDADTKKGDLDMTALKPDFTNRDTFETWVKIHDLIANGEMPPAKKKQRPAAGDVAQVTAWLDNELTTADTQRHDAEGRAVIRRLTRVEYENAVRDLFALPALKIKDLLPADGTRKGYDKLGEALDLSDVQLGKYLEAADFALDAAIATRPTPPPVLKRRIYPASQANFHKMVGTGNGVLLKKFGDGFGPDPLWPAPGQLMGKAYMDSFEESARAGVPQSRSAVGLFHPNDNYMQTGYGLSPLYAGRYRLRLSLWSFVWNAGTVQASPKTEVAMLHVGPRTLGYFDAPSLAPTVSELTPWLDPGEEVFFDSASLYIHDNRQIRRQKGGLAAYVGPGIATDWLEVEGPIFDQWPPQSHRRLFGDLPIAPFDPATGARAPQRSQLQQAEARFWPQVSDLPEPDRTPPLCTVASSQPVEDAVRLLAGFLPRAFRRQVGDAEVQRYAALVQARLAAKDCFEDAMRYACKAALTSTSFLFRMEKPGRLDDNALASRLAFWLWNSTPDDELLALAREGKLHEPKAMDAEVERMLNDAKSDRFITDFLDQWLKLREIDSTDPDSKLYPEYHLYLKESMLSEARLFLRELIARDLSTTNVVSSDFLMMNERLAEHYRFIGPVGSEIRKVPIPADSERSGLLTMGAVMKVTANGTNTSPVIRGLWMSERILGQSLPPQPQGIAAIDPDTHGATTIREQLEKHRADPICAGCHAKMDPPGFALEVFDVIGGVRERYRSLGVGYNTGKVFSDNFRPLYKLGTVVDSSGKLVGGFAFQNINELRAHLLADPDQITANLARQLLTYATGADLTYADRREITRIVADSKRHNHGVRNLIHLLAQSDLFQRK